MKSPYNDIDGTPLFKGDKIIGRTNFDIVQAVVIFKPDGINDLERWKIQIIKTQVDGIWTEEYKYELLLAYHIEKNNNCKYYKKINEFTIEPWNEF
jgi:hypothetical protein